MTILCVSPLPLVPWHPPGNYSGQDGSKYNNYLDMIGDNAIRPFGSGLAHCFTAEPWGECFSNIGLAKVL